MPFAIKDVLQHKRNDRQIREIHEREYRKYLHELRQQQHQQPPPSSILHSTHATNPYYLSFTHINEIERSRLRSAITKQHHYAQIQRENAALYQRLLQANQRPAIDARNHAYAKNLNIFNTKRVQQRFNDYKRIDNDNQALIHRLRNVRGNLISKDECEHDWQKHLVFMKKNCDYPENLDRFVSKANHTQRQQTALHSAMRSVRWNDRYSIAETSSSPLAILLDRSQ